MPLRDHFKPPLSKRGWQAVHAMWPAKICEQIASQLPERFVVEPRVQLGTYYEIDIGALDQGDDEELDTDAYSFSNEANGGGVAIAPAIHPPLAPTNSLNFDFFEPYVYEVLIFDFAQERRLVAAIELASPGNKDRPDSRRLFVATCCSLLRKDVCLSIIDLVTNRNFNLYADLLALNNRCDPTWGKVPPATYAVTCLKREEGKVGKLDVWSKPLVAGEPLPQLPLWLPGPLNIAVDLESTYEDTCRVLRLVK
jgi:hypothetical protein